MKHSTPNKLVRKVSALSVRKTYLERRIMEEMKKRVPHAFTLQHLKKLKLHAKDRLAEAQRQLGQGIADASLMMTGGGRPEALPVRIPIPARSDRSRRLRQQMRNDSFR